MRTASQRDLMRSIFPHSCAADRDLRHGALSTKLIDVTCVESVELVGTGSLEKKIYDS
jgi:hypothetical protein